MPHYVPLSLGLSMGRGSNWGLRCPGPGQMWPGHARCPHACRGPASLSSTDTGGPLPLPSLYHLVLLMLEKLPKLWSNLLLSPQGKFPYFPPGLWGQCKLGLRSRQKLCKEKKKGQRKKTQGRREEKEVGWGGGDKERESIKGPVRGDWDEGEQHPCALARLSGLDLQRSGHLQSPNCEYTSIPIFIRHEVSGKEARVRSLELTSQLPESSLSATELFAQETKLRPHAANFCLPSPGALCWRQC